MTRRFVTSILLSLLLLGLMAVFISRLGDQVPAAQSGPELSEIMASNKGSVADGYGGFPDWIELHNPTQDTMDISGFGLSDNLMDGAKFVFPAGTEIQPGGYIVVFCSGGSESPMHAPFKINSSEEVILFDTSGRAMDSVALKAVSGGNSIAWSGGGWADMAPSPGHPNTPEGIAAYESTLTETEVTGLYINEFMASNSTTIGDSFGSYSDWIELYNANSADMDISGYGISDSLSQPMKYVIPEGVIVPAGGYLVIFCSGNEGIHNGELHAPFGLRAYEEDVVISSPKGLVIDSYSYSAQDGDVSMARTPDGTGDFIRSAQPTPGYPNTSDGYAAFSLASRLPLSPVHISEFASAGPALTLSGYGECDWVELFNGGGEQADISGYGISNNPNNPAKWVFPEGTTLSPGEYLLLYATGENLREQKKNLRLNFNISASGESLFLFDREGKLIDKLSAGSLPQGVSYGRDQSDTRLYYTSLTPGKDNGTGYQGMTSTPALGILPGIYDGAVELTISAGAGETIRYTTDCTTPTGSSPEYSGPIQLSSNTVIRAAAFKEGSLTGQTVSGTYLFTSDQVNHALPVATLVTDPSNLWDSKTGIYAYGDGYDEDTTNITTMLESALYYQSKFTTDEEAWERPAAFAIFDEEGRQEFSQNVDIRISGSYGRSRAQKGFNISASSEYGSGWLNFPFFENRPYENYKAVTLRSGAQNQNYSKINDEFATGILEGSDVNFLYQAYEPYVLYLNGEYWGVYFLKEKRNRFFVAQHEDTENYDDMDIVKSTTRVSYGTVEEWAALMKYVDSHDLSSSSGEAYKYLESRMDMDSFIDYMACEIYVGQTDTWNVQMYKLPGGKWKFIYYDFCWSLGNSGVNHNTIEFRKKPSVVLSDMFVKLLENPDFRDRLARRTAELMNTVFTQERMSALLEELYAQVEPEIRREREKFNGETFMGVKQLAEVRGDYDRFQSEIEKMRQFVAGRNEALKKIYQSELGLSDSYMQEVFG